MSLQVCHCGWSKVTTHHGLRTHQGKMGCTPKGVTVAESEQKFKRGHVELKNNQKDINPDKAYYYSDMDVQVCHCGWSKYTTYHGLRTHQGKMGCTPQGVRIPRNEQYNWKNEWEEMVGGKYQPAKRETVKKEEKRLDREPPMPAYPETVVDTDHPTAATIKEQPESPIPQRSSKSATKSKAGHQLQDFSTLPQMYTSGREHPTPTYPVTVEERKKKKDRKDQTLSETAPVFPSINSATATTIKEKPKSAFRTPQQSVQKATDSKAGQQVQESCTGLQVNGSGREVSRTPPLATVVQRKEKDRKDQTPSQAKELAQMFAGTTTQEAAVRQKKKYREEQNLWKVKLLAQELAEATTVKVKPLAQKVSATIPQIAAIQPEEEDEKDQNLAQGSVDAEWLEINNLLEVVRVAEDAQQKSLDLSLSTPRTTKSTMMKQTHQELERMSSIVDVKMDPTTAHRCLVSADGKKVSYRGGNQEAPGRFGNVLGLNRLTSGKSYWEVVVSSKTGWNLGVARGDANHRGKLPLNPGSGSWVTEYFDNENTALTTPPVELSLKEKPQKVGVFVDSEEGLVSFYNVTTQSHIYSFTGCSFTGEIYPYFSLHLKENGESADPLIISPVEHQ